MISYVKFLNMMWFYKTTYFIIQGGGTKYDLTILRHVMLFDTPDI